MSLRLRYLEHLKANSLSNFTYTWNTSYARILARDSYNSGVVSTASTALTITATNYATTTHEYIYPAVLANTLVLDGVGLGNIKLTVLAGFTTNAGGSVTVQCYAVLNVYARNVSGTDRLLGTYTTGTVSQFHDTGSYPTSTSKTEELPVAITFDNAKVAANERIVLSIVFYSRWIDNGTGYAAWKYGTATIAHTMNSDDLYVVLPIAGG